MKGYLKGQPVGCSFIVQKQTFPLVFRKNGGGIYISLINSCENVLAEKSKRFGNAQDDISGKIDNISDM